MSELNQQIEAAEQWFGEPRFAEITRLYSARDVAEQQGTLSLDYSLAHRSALAFYGRLRELFERREQITTFGPYSPGQAVAMKRAGIEGIYLGGWATSAKGSADEDPGPDLASYPLSQVPNEAAAIVRALVTADRNQAFARARLSDRDRRSVPAVDFSPFIIADADTGHGGDAHVRNLIRRFVEAGVPGYHIEDQRPGAKKCGHQAGKVLVSSDEQIKRLNAARFQLDVMRVAGIIVARTDAEAATFIDSRSDERDQPFILGATRLDVPSYKAGYIAILRQLARRGVPDTRGHLLFSTSTVELEAADAWLDRVSLMGTIERLAAAAPTFSGGQLEKALEAIDDEYAAIWQVEAGLKTYAEAVADAISAGPPAAAEAGSVEEWLRFAERASLFEASARAKQMGLDVAWDCELPKTPEGFYQVRGGLSYAIAKSLAAAPYADLLWMETKTADLEDAKAFAEAIHAQFPDKMLAYNLSPSFNWDTTGMTDEDMRAFSTELGSLGFVFNFITYGGHQIDGVASEEFARALKQDGMLALAKLQRRLRLIGSPYRTPQTLVGGPRLDAALMAASGRTAATKAMGHGSTQSQHLKETEVPVSVLRRWIGSRAQEVGPDGEIDVQLAPQTGGSDVLTLTVGRRERPLATVVSTTVRDRKGRTILMVVEHDVTGALHDSALGELMVLYLLHRFGAASIYMPSPSASVTAAARRLIDTGVLRHTVDAQAELLVAEVDHDGLKQFVAAANRSDRAAVATTSS